MVEAVVGRSSLVYLVLLGLWSLGLPLVENERTTRYCSYVSELAVVYPK
jgi:hypothetical protein